MSASSAADTNPALALYVCDVMHARLFPQRYRFNYRIFSLLLDVDRLHEVAKASPLLSLNRFNLLSFFAKDHLPAGSSESLGGYIRRTLTQHGIDAALSRVRLLCMPRLLGYGFNPLSVWYCENAHGELLAILCEVRNTFGERHCYLLRPDDAAAKGELRARHAKQFHVSPFISLQAEYRFRFSPPQRHLRIHIKEYQDDRLMLIATQQGEATSVNTASLTRALLAMPLMTFKVMAAIHWQALKIWLRGGRYHRKPEPPSEEVS